MNELSLFSGAGGGVYASKLLGHRIRGYVEFNPHCQRVIAQRIRDGIFDEAPIFSDIRSFVGDGYADRYKGMVDIVSGGFPCQPFSVAGKRQSSDDSRDMWPATMDVIRAIRPANVFLENVPGLLSANESYCQNCGDRNWQFCEPREKFICGTCEVTMDGNATRPFFYFGKILRDLAESGYDARWCVLGADDCGAPHHRKRLWIYAYSKHDGSPAPTQYHGNAENVSNNSEGPEVSREPERVDTPRDVANPQSESSNGDPIHEQYRETKFQQPRNGCGEAGDVSNTNGVRSSESWWAIDPSYTKTNEKGEIDRAFYDDRWGVESPLGRVANGVANRIERLRATGNGQVPIVAATAFKMLSGR